jgi:hypothetical protein
VETSLCNFHARRERFGFDPELDSTKTDSAANECIRIPKLRHDSSRIVGLLRLRLSNPDLMMNARMAIFGREAGRVRQIQGAEWAKAGRRLRHGFCRAASAHVQFIQARNFSAMLMKGDEREGAMLTDIARQVFSRNLPGDK